MTRAEGVEWRREGDALMLFNLVLPLLWLAGPAATPPHQVNQFDTTSIAPVTGPVETSDKIAAETDKHERMTVPVTLAGAGPFRFMVDTGSNRTAVSREVAARLGLIANAEITVHSATGESRISTTRLPELRMSKKKVNGIAAPLLMRADMGADGILGIDSLASHRVLFDFRDQQLSIVSASAPVSRDEHDAIVVRAKRRDGRLIVTDATAAGSKVNVVLDTGAQFSVGNAALRDRLAAKGMVKMLGQVELLSVTGDRLVGELGFVSEMSIGDVFVRDVAIVFADAHTFRELKMNTKPALLLGMNTLRSFDVVSIDFASRKLRLVLPDGGMKRRWS